MSPGRTKIPQATWHDQKKVIVTNQSYGHQSFLSCHRALAILAQDPGSHPVALIATLSRSPGLSDPYLSQGFWKGLNKALPGLPCGPVVKSLADNAGDTGLIPGPGGIPRSLEQPGP